MRILLSTKILKSKDQFDRKQVHRMPWRDEAFVLFGKSASDLARHFIQRWNHAKVRRRRKKSADSINYFIFLK